MTSAGDISALMPALVTNSVICEVYRKATGPKSVISWKQVAIVISRMYNTPYSQSSVCSSFKCVHTSEKKLRKSKRDADKHTTFLKEVYIPPKHVGKSKMFTMANVLEDGTATAEILKEVNVFEQVAMDLGKENVELQLKTDAQCEEIQGLNANYHQLKQEHAEKFDKLKQEHAEEYEKIIEKHIKLEQKYAILDQTATATRTKLNQLYKVLGKVDSPKRVVQQSKRKNHQAEYWKAQASKWRKMSIKMQGVAEGCHDSQRSLRRLQAQVANRKYRLKQKCRTKQKSIPKEDKNMLKQSLGNAVSMLQAQKEHISYVEDRLLSTEERLQDVETIPTRDPLHAGRIHPAFKVTSMLLQGIGVAEHEVGPAIETVISTLTPGKLDGKLPSTSFQQTVSGVMHAVSKQHMREVLANQHDMTVKYDGTTKSGHHIVEVEVETKDNTYFVGGMESVGGTATDYVDCITEALSDVDPTMLKRISNTMTDRCITNSAVDRGLSQVKGADLNSFRCAVHPLDSIHKQCDTFVKAYEHKLEFCDNVTAVPYQKGGESRTQATLKCIDKMFHSNSCGLPKELPQFLRSRGIKGGENRVLYPRWVGNRFNIYFFNAGLLYMYDELIREFQTKVIKPRNGLHHAVRNIMSLNVLQPVLRALGLVSKYLTGPWMRWQGMRQGILETSNVFSNVLETLDNIDTCLLVTGFENTAFGFAPKMDDQYAALTKSTSQDDETALVLGGLLHEASEVMKRQLADHLPGGKYHAPNEVITMQAQSCSSNNISGERVFARVDARMTKSKSATITKVIHKVQFKINKVPQYLKNKTEAERMQIIRQATTEAGKDRILEKDRQMKLQKAMVAKLEESHLQMEIKAQNNRKSKEKIIESVIVNGMWETEEDIHTCVRPMSKTKAMLSLKSQIHLRLDILGCEHPVGAKMSYTKATQGELQLFLKELIQMPIPEDKEDIVALIKDPSSIVGLNFNQKWSTDGVDTMCQGSILKLEDTEGNKSEYRYQYECSFNDEEEHVFQKVSEVLADIVVGDMFLHVS